MSISLFESLLSGRRLRATAFLALGLTSVAAHAQQASAPGQGQACHPMPAVAPDQSQVIFFRSASAPAGGNPPGAAHVYVNGEFHAALLPHGFTRLCVAQGAHSIEAYVGDAPEYSGKAQPGSTVDLEGGRTVFIAVDEQGAEVPEPYRRPDAEHMLSGAHEQRHVISRASAVQACREVAEAAPVERRTIR